MEQSSTRKPIKGREQKAKARAYMAQYRLSHGIIQFNCNLNRAIKAELDEYLSANSMTAGEFVTQAVNKIVSKGHQS
jgi:hypothetical protein